MNGESFAGTVFMTGGSGSPDLGLPTHSTHRSSFSVSESLVVAPAAPENPPPLDPVGKVDAETAGNKLAPRAAGFGGEGLELVVAGPNGVEALQFTVRHLRHAVAVEPRPAPIGVRHRGRGVRDLELEIADLVDPRAGSGKLAPETDRLVGVADKIEFVAAFGVDADHGAANRQRVARLRVSPVLVRDLCQIDVLARRRGYRCNDNHQSDKSDRKNPSPHGTPAFPQRSTFQPRGRAASRLEPIIASVTVFQL